jgi:hypothetical protein
MDAFKTTIIFSVILSVACLVIVGVVSEEMVRNASIPASESGVVASKTVSDGNYVVGLVDGRSLFIQNDTVLYDSIVENHSYSFDCRIDHGNNRVVVMGVNPQAGLVASKGLVTDKAGVSYSVSLANGKIFYIANNATLYDVIALNGTYLFDCKTDYGAGLVWLNGVKSLP